MYVGLKIYFRELYHTSIKVSIITVNIFITFFKKSIDKGMLFCYNVICCLGVHSKRNKYAAVAELADALDFASSTSVKELLITVFPFS